MSFYRFTPEDIIDTAIRTHPSFVAEKNANLHSGSVYLERPYLESSLRDRIFIGLSQKEGGVVHKTGSISASIDIRTATSASVTAEWWHTFDRMYDFYSLQSNDYRLEYNGTKATSVRYISIPEIYYDREILTGSFTASDADDAGTRRNIYDNGRGGLYSGSLSGTLVGHIFYQEGLAVLTKPDLTAAFGSPTGNFKWRIEFKGVHTIPVKVFRCRAQAGQLNASTNPTFYTIPASGSHKNMREIVSGSLSPYITKVGIFDDMYNLVAVCNIAQPIKKREEDDIIFRIRMDW